FACDEPGDDVRDRSVRKPPPQGALRALVVLERSACIPREFGRGHHISPQHQLCPFQTKMNWPEVVASAATVDGNLDRMIRPWSTRGATTLPAPAVTVWSVRRNPARTSEPSEPPEL